MLEMDGLVKAFRANDGLADADSSLDAGRRSRDMTAIGCVLGGGRRNGEVERCRREESQFVLMVRNPLSLSVSLRTSPNFDGLIETGRTESSNNNTAVSNTF